MSIKRATMEGTTDSQATNNRHHRRLWIPIAMEKTMAFFVLKHFIAPLTTTHLSFIHSFSQSSVTLEALV
jgi:hypothetical protein